MNMYFLSSHCQNLLNVVAELLNTKVFSRHHRRVYFERKVNFGITELTVPATVVDESWNVFSWDFLGLKEFLDKLFVFTVLHFRNTKDGSGKVFYEWTIRMEGAGFKAGQKIYIYLKDSMRSLRGYDIEDNHAKGEEMVIREPASIFDPAQRENYQFWYVSSFKFV
jgi:hypothetical protein